MKRITIVLTIPQPLLSKLNSELKMLHKKYGTKCKSSGPNDEEYYDIPHITLFSMGECYENKEKIEAKIREIAKNFQPIKIKSKELTLFEFEEQCHLVVTIEKNKELQELHNKIINEVLPLSVKKGIFVLEKYTPHSSKILYLPRELGKKAKQDAKIKEFEFTANEIGIKVRQEDTYCIIEKTYKLGENK